MRKRGRRGFKDFTAVGDVTNTAARLTARAGVGEVLVDEATRAAVPEFPFISADQVTLKGRSTPVQTFRLALELSAVGSSEPIAVLQGSPLFAGLPRQLTGALRQRVHRRFFPAGTYLTREGEPADCLYMIERGLVRVARTSRHGRELILGLFTAGDTIGELGVLEATGTRTADAIAIEPTSCITLAREDLHAAVRTTPELGLRLMSALVAYVRRKDEELAEIAFLDVPGRLAHKLLQLAARHGEPVDGGVRMTIRVSQGELASMVGATRENINRALSRFVTLGAVAIDRGTITILDADRLRSLC